MYISVDGPPALWKEGGGSGEWSRVVQVRRTRGSLSSAGCPGPCRLDSSPACFGTMADARRLSTSPTASVPRENVTVTAELVGKILRSGARPREAQKKILGLLSFSVTGQADKTAPAMTLLNMVGMSPYETNHAVVSCLCDDIRNTIKDLTAQNLILCLKYKIMKFVPLLSDKNLRDTVLDIVHHISPADVNTELTRICNEMWVMGMSQKPYLLSLVQKFPLYTKQRAWLDHGTMFEDELDEIFAEYCRESMLLNGKLGVLRGGDRRAEIASIERMRKSISVEDDALSSNKLYKQTTLFLYTRYLRTGNPWYGALRADLVADLRVNNFPFQTPDHCEDFIKSLEDLANFDIGAASSVDDVDFIVQKVGMQLKELLKLAEVRPYKIQRLVDDEEDIQKLDRTYKFKGNNFGGQKKRGVPHGGILIYSRGKFTYQTRAFKTVNEGETIHEITIMLKHKYHQAQIRKNMGCTLSVKYLKESILVYFNKLKFPQIFARLTPSSKLQDHTIIYIPTDDEILEHMQNGGGLSNFDTPLVGCQKELLKFIEDKTNFIFNNPAVNAFDSDELRATYLVEIEKPMDKSLVLKNLTSGVYDGDAGAFLEDYFLIFDNCIRYWEKRSDPLMLVLLSLKKACYGYTRFMKSLEANDLLREYADIERQFAERYAAYSAKLETVLAAGAAAALEKGAAQVESPNVVADVVNAAPDEPPAATVTSTSPNDTPSNAAVKEAPAPANDTKESTPGDDAAPLVVETASADDSGPKEPSTDAGVPSLRDIFLATIHHARNEDKTQLFETSDGLHQFNKYLETIPNPMGLADAEAMVNRGEFSSPEAFWEDFVLIYDNCIRYHSSKTSLFAPKAKKHYVSVAKRLKSKSSKFFHQQLDAAGFGETSGTLPKAVVSLKPYGAAAPQKTVTKRLSQTLVLKKAYTFIVNTANDPYKIFPKDSKAKGFNKDVYFKGETGIFTYEDIEKQLDTEGYDGEAGKHKFIEDMTKVYKLCMKNYAAHKEFFCYKWAEYCLGRLDGFVRDFLMAKGAFPGDDVGGKSAIEVNHKNMLQILSELCRRDATRKAAPFMFSCPVSLNSFPNYTRFVSQPMDYLTIRQKLDMGRYAAPEDFFADLNLVFDNAERYNHANEGIIRLAQKERDFCQKKEGMIFPSLQRTKSPTRKDASLSHSPAASSSAEVRRSRSLSKTKGPSGRRVSPPREKRDLGVMVLMDVLMILSSPPVRQCLNLVMSEVFRRSLFASSNASDMQGTSQLTDDTDFETSLLNTLHAGNQGASAPELADDFAAKCTLPVQNSNLRKLSRWLCLAANGQVELIRESLLSTAIKSPQPFFCKCMIDIGAGNSRLVDSYDFILRNTLPELGKAYLESYVKSRVSKTGGRNMGLNFGAWAPFLSEEGSGIASIPDEMSGEEKAQREGLSEVILEQFMMSTIASIRQGDYEFAKAALGAIVSQVNIERLLVSCVQFSQLLVSAFFEVVQPGRLSDIDFGMANILATEYFQPLLGKLRAEKFMTKLSTLLDSAPEASSTAGFLLHSFVFAHVSVSTFVSEVKDVEGDAENSLSHIRALLSDVKLGATERNVIVAALGYDDPYMNLLADETPAAKRRRVD